MLLSKSFAMEWEDQKNTEPSILKRIEELSGLVHEDETISSGRPHISLKWFLIYFVSGWLLVGLLCLLVSLYN